MRFRRATVDDSRRLDAQIRAHKAAGAGGGLEEEREEVENSLPAFAM